MNDVPIWPANAVGMALSTSFLRWMWRGAHSAVFSPISGCADRSTRQKDGTS